VLRNDIEIFFAHHSFKWANSAARNAGVTCVIVGIAPKTLQLKKTVFDGEFSRSVSNINGYLVDGANIYVESQPKPMSRLPAMLTGSVPNDGGNLLLMQADARLLRARCTNIGSLIHPFFGSEDFLQGQTRYCLVIADHEVEFVRTIPDLADRLDRIVEQRSDSKKKETREQLAQVPHRFQHRGPIPEHHVIIVPSVSSERREWFPAGLLQAGTVVSNRAFMIVDSALWNLALLASRLHLVWIATVCGKLKTDYRYANTLGWNTFPVPILTDKNKADLKTLRRGHPICTRGAFSGDDRRSL